MFRLRFTPRQAIAVVAMVASAATTAAPKGCSSDSGGKTTSKPSTAKTSAPVDGFVVVTGSMVCNNGKRPDAIQLVAHLAKEFDHHDRPQENRQDFTVQTKPGHTFKIKFTCGSLNYESANLTTASKGVKLVCRDVKRGNCR